MTNPTYMDNQAHIIVLESLARDLAEGLKATLLCPACGGSGEVDINDFGGIAPEDTMDICPCCGGEEYTPDFSIGVEERIRELLARAREAGVLKEKSDVA